MSNGSSKPYAIGSDEEHDRLERQARIGKIEDHLTKFSFARDAVILDAGCGSGSMTRLLAKAAPDGRAIGVDVSEDHLSYARMRAQEEAIENISFETGDIFSLPFEDNTFDRVWSKYVLQWVNNPVHAVAEFRRVTRPGGKVVCCNFDGFSDNHYPVDEAFQNDVDRVFNHVVDPNVGRKMFSMFRDSGLTDIKVDFEPDATYTVSGAIDAERRQNWVDQFGAAFKAISECLGSDEAAQSFVDRFLEYQDREDTITACALYFVEGVVP
tara:strand:- start:544 stop:1347 length:804 start_codon:yes stop_codon:yes gene_type:complete